MLAHVCSKCACVQIEGLEIDVARREIRFGRKSAKVTPQVAKFVKALAEGSGRLVSPDELKACMWSIPPVNADDIIRIAVFGARSAFREIDCRLAIRSTYKRGYFIDAA